MLNVDLVDSSKEPHVSWTSISSTSRVTLLTVLSKISSPLVDAQPVGHSVVDSPSDDLRVHSSLLISCRVHVDPCFVVPEVVIDDERSNHGSVGHDLRLNVCHLLADRVMTLSKVFVLFVSNWPCRIRRAVILAGRSVIPWAGNGSCAIWVFLITRVDGIGFASELIFVAAPSAQPMSFPPLENVFRPTSIASEPVIASERLRQVHLPPAITTDRERSDAAG